MSLPPPLALTPCLPTELLSYVLRQTCPPTLIVCSVRTAFLSSLLEATSPPPPQPQTRQDPNQDPDPAFSQPPSPSEFPPNTQEEDPSSPPPQHQPQPQPQLQPPHRHPLLTATIHQISLSRHTTTAFIPTVSHLRAYLTAFSPSPVPKQVSTDHDIRGTQTQSPLLVVYGLVELHRGTSEWSTQGLGNTCAALVEAGRRVGRRVVLIEERRVGDDEEGGAGEEGGEEGEDADDNDGEDDGESNLKIGMDVRERRGKGIWHEKLPILSGSVRRAGAKVEYGGRTVEVGMVLRRWFVFGRGEWEDGGYA